jgi:hypothetical protein
MITTWKYGKDLEMWEAPENMETTWKYGKDLEMLGRT